MSQVNVREHSRGGFALPTISFEALDGVFGGAKDDEGGTDGSEGTIDVPPPPEVPSEPPTIDFAEGEREALAAQSEAQQFSPEERDATLAAFDDPGEARAPAHFDVPQPEWSHVGELPSELVAPEHGAYEQRLALPDDARHALDAAQIAANQRALVGFDEGAPEASQIRSVEPTFTPVFNSAGDQVGEQLSRSVMTMGDGTVVERHFTPDPIQDGPLLSGSPGEPHTITWNHTDGSYERSMLHGSTVFHDSGTVDDAGRHPTAITAFRHDDPGTAVHFDGETGTATGIATHDGRIHSAELDPSQFHRALTGDTEGEARLHNGLFEPGRDGNLLHEAGSRSGGDAIADYMRDRDVISSPDILALRADRVNRTATAVDEARKALAAEGGFFPNQDRVKIAQEQYMAAQREHLTAISSFNEAQSAASMLGKPLAQVPQGIKVETNVPQSCPSELSIIGAVVGPKAAGTNNQPIAGLSYDFFNPEKGVTHFEGAARETFKFEGTVPVVTPSGASVPVTGRINGNIWVLGTGRATDGNLSVDPTLPNGMTIQSNNGGAVTVGTKDLNAGLALQAVLTDKQPDGCVYTGVRFGPTVKLGPITVNGWLQYRAGH